MKHHLASLFTSSIASRTLWLGLFFSLLLFHLFFGFNLAARGAQPTLANDSKTSILILATNHVSEAKLMELQQLARDTSLTIDYKLLDDLKEGDALSDVITPYQLVIFDSVSGHEAEMSYAKFSRTVKTHPNKIFVPIKLLKTTPLRHGISEEHAKLLYDYYDNGGMKNFRRMLAYVETRLFLKNQQTVEPPIIFPKTGIYHPQYDQMVFASLDEYRAWKGNVANTKQVTVAIAMTKNAIASNQTQLVDELIQRIEQRGGLAIPYYFVASPRGAPDYTALLQHNGQTLADVMINTRILHWGAARKAEFEKLGIPIIQALPYSNGDQKKWEEDQAGIPAVAIPFFLTYAEIAGAIDPLIVAAMDEQSKKTVSIDYQLTALVDKVFGLANLKHKPNADKRIAVMFYNYPSGEKNAGASFLNIPQSLESISEALIKAGYQVDQLTDTTFIDSLPLMLRPFYRNEPYTQVLEHNLGGLLPLKTYLSWYQTVPQDIRANIEAKWGKPADSFTVYEVDGQPHFIIPRLKVGNLMVLPQPPRGNNKDREQEIYHSQRSPASHTYLAAYLYSRQQFQADAIVHLGTHGTHEWLPGKERGLSMYDPGNLSAGSTPIIYPYIVDDVGEALQTKRRGRATVISHSTPPFRRAGLYKELAQIHELEHQYSELDEGAVKEKTKGQLIDLIIERNIHADLKWDREKIEREFTEFLTKLHDYLHDLAQANQPLGLHTYGTVAINNHLTSTIVQMLGPPFVTLANEQAFLGSLDEQLDTGEGLIYGFDSFMRYQELERTPEYLLVKKYIVEGTDLSDISNKELLAFLEQARGYYADLRNQQEIESLTMALEGKYIQTSTGGGPINNPDSLPTGRNLYGFDPSKIPTKAAYEAGKELMNNMLGTFYAQHGRYPEKVTFNLWSIETMRHFGVLEAQMLHAIGVKPTWNEQGKVTGTEIVPYSELKRPRVDIVASPTGLYRDAFPNVMMLISKAIQEIANLKGKHNFIAQHAQTIEQDLLKQGLDSEEAHALSTVRFFSNESGEYGTGLEVASLASDTWETDDKLAKMYLDRMGYFYGSDEKTWGKNSLMSISMG